jgi:hypothetical protein
MNFYDNRNYDWLKFYNKVLVNGTLSTLRTQCNTAKILIVIIHLTNSK